MENLLLEIGSEEIPAGYIQPALEALSTILRQRLTNSRIDHGNVKTFGTPRRLAVMVEGVAAKQAAVKTEMIGPPASVAFDAQGKPTVAAHKFAEKAGVTVSRLKVKETEKGSYLVVEKTERGSASSTLLKQILADVILATPFPKKMRWADLEIEFARPIHSILALYGKQLIQFQLGNMRSGRSTQGHCFMSPSKIKLAHADAYLDELRKARVLADIAERKAGLRREITSTAQSLGGQILPDEELVDINTNLVEYPIAVAGKFDQEFLEVPEAILITAMREHQKYFSVVDRQGKLMPCFVSVNNTAARDMALVGKGHERVIRARLADAKFFYRADLEVSNDERVEKLKGVLFQAQLGTMFEKAQRAAKIAAYLAAAASSSANVPALPDLQEHVTRAARLCKSDLVSHVVGEFPKLQGIMGRIYATLAGEAPEVAVAVEEHYRPVYSGATLPQSLTGAILGIADKIDTICGCFSVGLVPTGASDPYALRRQGIGIVQIMLDRKFAFSLQELIQTSLRLFGEKDSAEADRLVQQIYTFIKNRIAHLLAEEGHSKDVIAAAVDVSVDHIPDVWNRVAALENLKSQPDFDALVAAVKRVGNIIKKSDSFEMRAQLDAGLFEHNSESALFADYQRVQAAVTDAAKRGAFDQALSEIASLRTAVDEFFNGVLVMAENERIRQNRLALLRQIATLFEQVADFSKISS
jgi:glycyl-tRNA synthetase beta chain